MSAHISNTFWYVDQKKESPYVSNKLPTRFHENRRTYQAKVLILIKHVFSKVPKFSLPLLHVCTCICMTVCCCMLQCVAVCCSALQCVYIYTSTLYVQVPCNPPPCTMQPHASEPLQHQRCASFASPLHFSIYVHTHTHIHTRTRIYSNVYISVHKRACTFRNMYVNINFWMCMFF